MEPVVHQSQSTRKKKNSTRVNITISIVVHALMFAAGAFWAAHEGVLGKKLQELSVFIVPKEKKAEEPKKVEQKVEPAKKVEQPKTVEQARNTAPPPPKFVAPPPAAIQGAAPPPPVISGFNFNPQDIVTSDDPVVLYKHQVENALRAKWDRPGDIADLDFVAEVELEVDASGKIVGNDWKKGSGDKRWDESVRRALAVTQRINRPPPKGFPGKFLVRFDVTPAPEPLAVQ